jgi:hypothetical protein
MLTILRKRLQIYISPRWGFKMGLFHFLPTWHPAGILQNNIESYFKTTSYTKKAF